jgi:hypothetical protein
MLLCVGPLGAGNVYKWTDESGQVHYGERKPARVSSESITVKRAPAIEESPLRGEIDYANRLEKSRKRREREKSKEQTAQKERKQKCEQLRGYRKFISQKVPLARIGADGERHYLTDQDRKAELEKLQKHLKRMCR